MTSASAMNCSNCGAREPTPLRQVEVTRLRRPALLYHCPACDFHGLTDPPTSRGAGPPAAVEAMASDMIPAVSAPDRTAAQMTALEPTDPEKKGAENAVATKVVATKVVAEKTFAEKAVAAETSAAPSWLSLAYEDAFYGDTGYVDRNLHAATLLRLTLAIGRLLGLGAPIGCDMGCGLGMLPRLLRDRGLDFWGSDEYAAMELIRPFCNPGPDLPIGCRTAFEVIEHVPDAAAFLRQQVGQVPLFVFSTLMRRDGEIPAEDWWYYAFGNGQHISFHSRHSFQLAMRKAGLDPASLVSQDGPRHPRALHAIAGDWRWRLAFRLATPLANRGLAWLLLPWLEPLQGLRCRIIPDHVEAMRLKAERSAACDVGA